MTLPLLAGFHHSSVLAMCWLLSIRFYFCPVFPYRYRNSLQPVRLLWDIFRTTLSDPNTPFLCPQGNFSEIVSGLGLCSKIIWLITWGKTFCANKQKSKYNQWKLHSSWAQIKKRLCGHCCNKCIAFQKGGKNQTDLKCKSYMRTCFWFHVSLEDCILKIISVQIASHLTFKEYLDRL